MNNLRIRAMSSAWNSRVEFLLMDYEKTGYGTQVIFEIRPDGAMVEPTFSIPMEQAQTLMDDLWNCGLRPTEGSGSAGALAATQKHLEDMRRLVFTENK